MKANTVNYNCNGTHILRAYLSGRLYNCLNFLCILLLSLMILHWWKLFQVHCRLLHGRKFSCVLFYRNGIFISQHINTLSNLRNLRLDAHHICIWRENVKSVIGILHTECVEICNQPRRTSKPYSGWSTMYIVCGRP